VRLHRPIEAPWREPVDVLLALGEAPWTVGFLSGGAEARWSYVAAEPEATLTISAGDRRNPFEALTELAGPQAELHPDGPPFQGGVAGLASYELGDHVEQLGLARLDGWPDLACGRYPAVLAFDHAERRLFAAGPQPQTALAWLDRPGRPPPRA
jgi:para-aminobenzoate synthetase component I